ncbi:MAG: vanadium-dependent haloperoxidase [Cytophagales bacterium]|nr:vanadium-dependent haloperoxidase [Cytophagales bacterium]
MKKNAWMVLALLVLLAACNDDETLTNNIDLGETINTDVSLADGHLTYGWTNVLLDLERYAQGRPNGSARAMAYIYLAAYETMVPNMEGYASMDDRFRGLRIRNSEIEDDVNFDLALNTAFTVALEHFLLNLPTEQRAALEAVSVSYEEQLAAGLSEEVISVSKSWGNYVAEQVIEYSQDDENAEQQLLDPQPLSYEPPTGDGFWTYSADPERALFPYWGEKARTFIISPDETTTVAPIEYSEEEGSAYYEEMMEVYTVNNEAKTTNTEQLWIAEFWSDDVEGMMMSPPVRQISIANQLVANFDLDQETSLAMLLKLGFALNDAAVAAWKYKYDYMVMRPNVFIHDFIDPDYQTNLYRLVYWPNPSFPGYPSGHSTFASAGAGVMIDYFGNAVNFTDRTHEGREEFLGEPRTFATLEDMAEENAYSRIPLGVHLRMDCTEGLRLGYEIADAVNALDMSRE